MTHKNGGNMKPFTKTANKWILSTLMIAALGSQYYFSVSSNTSGHFELSSTAAEELAEKLKQLKATPDITEAEHAKRKHELLVQYNKLINAENAVVKKAPVVKATAETVAAPASKETASKQLILILWAHRHQQRLILPKRKQL